MKKFESTCMLMSHLKISLMPSLPSVSLHTNKKMERFDRKYCWVT